MSSLGSLCLCGEKMFQLLPLVEMLVAVEHMGFSRKDLSLETNLVLEMMSYLEGQLGKDQVRLVFGIE